MRNTTEDDVTSAEDPSEDVSSADDTSADDSTADDSTADAVSSMYLAVDVITADDRGEDAHGAAEVKAKFRSEGSWQSP